VSERSLSEETRRGLLDLARRSIDAAFRGEPEPRLASDRAEAFGEPRALFVTLRKSGDLRGCIGTLSPHGDVARTVPAFARRAAFEDPRFPPLSEVELALCAIEISVLTPPTAVHDPSEIEIGRDGLILDVRGYSGLLLPQVATEWGFDRERFLEELSLKAGLPRDGWKSPDARIWRFQAEVFAEGDPAGEAESEDP
jgi:AmmeMemoRadiSam system protein A